MLTYHLFRFFSRLLKTVYRFFPTTDVNLSTCSEATFENSLRTLPNNGCCSIADSTSRFLKIVHGFSKSTDVNLSLVQILLKANNHGRSHSPEFSLSPAEFLQSPAESDFQTFSPQSFEEAFFGFPSEVSRVTSHQTKDSQSGLPGMSLLVGAPQ